MSSKYVRVSTWCLRVFIVGAVFFSFASSVFAATWAVQVGSGKRQWNSIDSSADGTKLVASGDYKIFRSVDGGVTWADTGQSGYEVASSADGMKLFVASALTSSDGGETWVSHAAAYNAAATGCGGLVSHAFSSDDGQVLARVDDVGCLIMSVDGGTTWANRTPIGSSGAMRALGGSGDGQTLVVGTYSVMGAGKVFVSTNAGVSWTERTPVPGWTSFSATVSDDGTIFVSGSGTYRSTNNGATWTYVFGGAQPSIDVSSDGDDVIVSDHISHDGGTTWTQQVLPGATNISAVTISADGSHMAVSTNASGSYGTVGYIYTSPAHYPSVTASTTSDITTTTATLNGALTDLGDSAPTIRGFQYGLYDSFTSSVVTVSESGSFSTGDFSLPITDLECDTLYHFRTFSTNAQGTGYSADTVFHTNICDTVALPDMTTAEISWATNRIGTSQIEYGLTSGYGLTTEIFNSYTTSSVNSLDDATFSGSYSGGTSGYSVTQTNVSSKDDAVFSGTYTDASPYDNFRLWISAQAEEASDFFGSGLDDAVFGGDYDGVSNSDYFSITINTEGLPDTFDWSSGNGSGTGIPIVPGPISLVDGITVTFGATTGHTTGDTWSYSLRPADEFSWVSNNGSGSNIPITLNPIDLIDGITVQFGSVSGHIAGGDPAWGGRPVDYWTYDVNNVSTVNVIHVSIDSEAAGLAVNQYNYAGGLDDATFSGTYTGPQGSDVVSVQIETEGAPDTFGWVSYYGSGSGIPITSGPIDLIDGISIEFGNTTGHTTGDTWQYSIDNFTADTFAFYDDNNECSGSNTAIDGTAQAVCNNIFITFDALSGHTNGDTWNLEITSDPNENHVVYLSGLSPGTLYHYRVISRDDFGRLIYSDNQTFTTNDLVPPTATTGSSSNIATTTADVEGEITDLGDDTPTVRGFEYGITDSYGSSVTNSGSFTTGTFTRSLTGLTCGTTYHYRAFAESSAGVGNGSDATFTTSACVSSNGGRSSGGRAFTCMDPNALNYNKIGVSKPSLCKYSTTPVVKTPPTTSSSQSVENILGSGACPANLAVSDFMKVGDKNGRYSSYAQKTTTQVNLLQAHINRILAVQYKQASGPVDGIFGPLTKEGVKRLQTALNLVLKPVPPLVIDGIVGPFTRGAINNSCGK